MAVQVAEVCGLIYHRGRVYYNYESLQRDVMDAEVLSRTWFKTEEICGSL